MRLAISVLDTQQFRHAALRPSGAQQFGADANANAEGHKYQQKCRGWHHPAGQWGVSGSDRAQHLAVALWYEDKDAEAGNHN